VYIGKVLLFGQRERCFDLFVQDPLVVV
jgi:hypothetical protein